MKKYLAAILLAMLAHVSVCFAQNPGNFPSGTVYGNSAATTKPPAAATLTAMFDRAFCATGNSALARIGSSWGCLPSANNAVWATNGSGVPSLTQTLPSAVQDNITRLGAITSVTSIVGLPAPSVSSAAATKDYVDSTASGRHYHPAAVASTTGVLPTTPTYNNGASGVGATLTAGSNAAIVQDGVTLNNGDLLLVKNQASQLQNGEYTVTDKGSGSTPWVLTRATTMDTPAEIAGGDTVFVTGGSQNINTTWTQTATVAAIGTDPIIFVQTGGSSNNAWGISGNDIFNNNTGNVGVGTATPATGRKLDIAGNAGLSTSAYFNWGATVGSTGYGLRDNSGAIQFKDSGGSWNNIPQETYINVMAAPYFAKNDGSTDDTTAIQAAITTQQTNGGCVYLPSGTGYLVTATLNATGTTVAFCMLGEQSAGGPGIFPANGSILLASTAFNNGDILFVRSQFGPTISKIKFDYQTVCAPTCTRRTVGGNGLHLSGPTSPASSMAYPRISNIVTQWQFFGIYVTNSAGGSITDTYHQSWVHSAIYSDRTATGIEISLGDIVGLDCRGDTVAPVTQIACITTQGGYMRVIGSAMGGAQIAILIDPAVSISAGNINITTSSFEEQSLCGITIQNTNGGLLYELQILGNEFSITAGSATGSICVKDNGSGPYIIGSQIINNSFRNIGNRTAIDIANGRGWIISNNSIHTAGGAQIGVATSTTNTIAPITVFDNVFPFESGSMTRYSFSATSGGVNQTTVRDLVGLAAASLPTGVANGSQIFVTDGAPGSACAGGSTGSMGFRQNNAWKCF